MRRIEKLFKEKKPYIGYLTAGDGGMQRTLEAAQALVAGGVDLLEVGIPFTDPIADGPVIQNASTISLNKGANIDKFFKILEKIRKETDIPLVLMTYTNILYRKGFDKFMQKAKISGIDGFILPDMAIEESKKYLEAARKNKLDTIFLISPNTSTERIKKILKATTGFLYLVSMYGTTGMRTTIQKYTIDAIRKTNKIVNKKIPLGIGFGINSPKESKKFLTLGADAVIIGSAFLRLIERTPPGKIESKITAFTKSLKDTTR